MNVFGGDGERVDNLVSKIKSFALNGLRTIIFNVHDYVGQDFPVKNCFYNSRLVEEMKGARERVRNKNFNSIKRLKIDKIFTLQIFNTIA